MIIAITRSNQVFEGETSDEAVNAAHTSDPMDPVVWLGPASESPSHFAAVRRWAHLRITSLVRGFVPLDIRRVRWDDASWMERRLHRDPGEEVADASGGYTLTLDYRDGAEGPLIARTVKTYTGGVVGPTSRTSTHTLFASDGDDYVWTDPAPKAYSSDEQVATGRERRRRHVDRLIASLQAAVVGGGGDPVALLTALLPAVEAFVQSASPAPVLAAVGSAAPGLLSAVEAALAPWIPPEDEGE